MNKAKDVGVPIRSTRPTKLWSTKNNMSGETILIVDDEESMRKSLADVMRDEGYDVVTASSGREGIDLLNETQPSLALLDIAMPGMDGIEVLRRFREMRPDMPVIMVTGHGTIETAVKS